MRGRIRSGIVVGLILFAGVVAGVLLTAQMGWTPVADGAEQAAQSPQSAAAGPASVFAPIAKAAMPGVVNISTTRVVRGGGGAETNPLLKDPFFREFFGEEFFRRFDAPRRENSLGSGVIVSKDGYIVTNYHVIAKADEIRVLLNDKREFTGKVVGADPPTDIAVIKIDAQNLPVIPWGDSNRLEVGEYVLAVGNPFALNSTVTMGIVSAVGRANLGIVDYEDFIQTDAAINPGNSGGALVNTRGELIGINSAIFSQSGGFMGVGFAVPSNLAKAAMDSLIKTGKVTRGWLGVSIQDITQDLAKQFGLKDRSGALVSEVLPDSPAAAAGLKPGDVVVRFAGKPVEGPTALRNMVAQAPIGKTAEIDVVRNDKRQTLEVKIVEQPPQVARAGAQDTGEGADSAANTALAGLEIRNLTSDIARQLGIPPDTRGVVVTGVAPESPAAGAGVRPGDVILEINRQRVSSLAELKRLSAKLSNKEPVLLLLNRSGSQTFLVLNPPPARG